MPEEKKITIRLFYGKTPNKLDSYDVPCGPDELIINIKKKLFDIVEKEQDGKLIFESMQIRLVYAGSELNNDKKISALPGIMFNGSMNTTVHAIAPKNHSWPNDNEKYNTLPVVPFSSSSEGSSLDIQQQTLLNEGGKPIEIQRRSGKSSDDSDDSDDLVRNPPNSPNSPNSSSSLMDISISLNSSLLMSSGNRGENLWPNNSKNNDDNWAKISQYFFSIFYTKKGDIPIMNQFSGVLFENYH